MVHNMKDRIIWKNLINQSWEKRSIIWLSGVRRSGKTYLCNSLDDVEYYDCELPSVRRQLEDIEIFLKSKQKKRLVLDEIHRLANPSEILKSPPNLKLHEVFRLVVPVLRTSPSIFNTSK